LSGRQARKAIARPAVRATAPTDAPTATTTVRKVTGPAKKVVTKRSPVKKTTSAKKVVAKRVVAKKSPVKKTAPAKKVVAKKVAARKSPARKAVSAKKAAKKAR
jgi:hypothetical protein